MIINVTVSEIVNSMSLHELQQVINLATLKVSEIKNFVFTAEEINCMRTEPTLIPAMKMVRDRIGCSLREAKNLVEARYQ